MNRLGILAALPDEARSLHHPRLGFGALAQLPGGHWLAVSGAGPANARLVATRLLEQGVAGLVSWGCAAALDPALIPGDLVLPERIQGIDGAILDCDPGWRGRFAQAVSYRIEPSAGALAESPVVIARVAAKWALREATGALAVDMESAAAARAAQAAGIPFLAVRAIADTSAMKLPDAVMAALNPRGDVRLGALLGHTLRHPGQIAELIRLGRAFGAAMATLRAASALAGGDFGFLPPREP
jgi:adenosylhomocysteine nucleosidase